MIMKKLTLLFSSVAFAGWLNAQTVVNIVDTDLPAGQTFNWTKDNVYLLDGLVFVEQGSTLNIQAGTVIKFKDGANPSALVICKNAKINAIGTKDEPIIFTAEADDVNDPTDLGPSDNMLWGGLVILGNGITEKNGNPTANVEGIPTTEPRGEYGGNNNDDNSGTLKYVSIRHGGREIAAGNELQNLTLAGVGSKTTLEYIEIYASSDDGIEFFGGAPNLKYAAVAFAEDDSFDWDELFDGKGQFWFSIQRSDKGDCIGELDGSTPDDQVKFSNPIVYNWTAIGAGKGTDAGVNPIGMLFRAGTAGTLANSIIIDTRNKAIEVQDKGASATNDALTRLQNGDLKILNNVFWNIADGTLTTLDATSTGIIRVTGSGTPREATASTLINHLISNKNGLENPELISISRIQDNNLDPRPSTTGAIFDSLAAYPTGDDFFTPVTYKGAFSPDKNDFWLAGWSTLARNGHLSSELNTIGVNEVKINEIPFTIYPNPVSNVANISLNMKGDAKIQLVDVSGKIIDQTIVKNIDGQYIHSFDVSNLNAGVYTIVIENNQKQSSQKFILH